MHIKYLELQSAFFGLQCFAKNLANCDILLRIDNRTAIAYIKRMGGIKFRELSNLAKDIWMWSEERNIWLAESYISSKNNVTADFESRHFESETEFELSNKAFGDIRAKLGNPEIDLFAKRMLNLKSTFHGLMNRNLSLWKPLQ